MGLIIKGTIPRVPSQGQNHFPYERGPATRMPRFPKEMHCRPCSTYHCPGWRHLDHWGVVLDSHDSMLKGNMKIIAPSWFAKHSESISSTSCFGPGHITSPWNSKNKPTRAMYQFNICSLTTYQIHDALQHTQVRPFRKKIAPLFHAFLMGIGWWISSYHPASNTASDTGHIFWHPDVL